MKIYFVRHGHPDYKTDTLTDLGVKQAKAAADRLKNCNIQRIFASSHGRAIQTAEHTAIIFGLEVIPCNFIREISWHSKDGTQIYGNGQPWLVADSFVTEGKSLCDFSWQSKEPFSGSVVTDSYKTVAEGIDVWLENLGFKREGAYYRVLENVSYENVAVFSHAGSSTAALSHLLNIPFPQMCEIVDVVYTSVTVIELSNDIGKLVSPKIRILNDAKHIETINIENVYGN